jgi:hypothetical protein
VEIKSVDGLTFAELARLKKYKVLQADKELAKQGIDYHLMGVYHNPKREVKLLFAVKRKKSKSKSKYLDRWTWIEYQKNSKEEGWIYGPAHFIAFERSNDFIIVNRKVLLEFILSSKCRVRWDMPFVKTAREAKYRIFCSPKNGAKITQILSKEILKLKGVQVWSKYDSQVKA